MLVHLRNARRLPGVVVTAIADPDPAALARGRRLVPDASPLDDAAGLVARGDVDAVVVTTPPATHAELAARALEAGKHVYLEKPVAIDRAGAARLAEARIEPGLVVTVGFNRRFHPVVVEARRLAGTELGPIVRVRSSFEEPHGDAALPGWKRERASGGGAPLDLGSHHVDLIRHLLGVPLTPVAAELASVRSEHDDCTLRFDADGCDVEIRCSFVRGRRDTIRLWDAAGRTLALDRWACTLEVGGRRVRTRSLAAARLVGLARPHADGSYRPSLSSWVERARGGEADGSPASLADGLSSLDAILAAEELAVASAR